MNLKKFVTRQNRYIDGDFVRASVEAPAIVTIDVDRFKPDKELVPVDEEQPGQAEPQKLKPPHSTARKDVPGRVKPKKGEVSVSGKQPGEEPRASDQDPAVDG